MTCLTHRHGEVFTALSALLLLPAAAGAQAPRKLRDSARITPASTLAQQGPVNPRLLPDISVVGDLVADLSPDGSTQEDGSRFAVREVELALQAAVDPSFRGDVFLGFSDEEGAAIEQAYLTAMTLPWRLEARMGRFLMPVGKQNTFHRHDLHTLEHSYIVQRFLGPEGAKGTGLWFSRIISPFGFFQEVLVTATERLGEAPEDLETEEPINKRPDGWAYSARLRNYWDLSNAANIEVSGSFLTGLREQPVSGAAEVTAVAARENLFGVDVTYRWRPPQQSLYKSFIVQAELMRRQNRGPEELPPDQGVVFEGPQRSFDGAYVFARWQTSRRGHIGARVDLLDDPEFDGGRTRALSGYYEYFPSEFSKLVAAFERVTLPGGIGSTNRILFQATFALGPHRPHPF